MIGLVSGYFRWLDGIIMRDHGRPDGDPGHPARHRAGLAGGAGLLTVIFAIVVPDVPRVVRLVRSIVLTVREEPYVEAAISVGTPTAADPVRHILPNTWRR